jgi:hypothetical protein
MVHLQELVDLTYRDAPEDSNKDRRTNPALGIRPQAPARRDAGSSRLGGLAGGVRRAGPRMRDGHKWSISVHFEHAWRSMNGDVEWVV